MRLSPIDFQRAAYGGMPVSLARCEWCGRGIDDSFYLANDAMICAVCRERARSVLPEDTRRTFWRAAGAGAVVAIGMSLLYLLLFRLAGTGDLGYLVAFGAIGVGYAIGRAMRKASGGAAGRRYQWTAALLTYTAITVAVTTALLGTRDLPIWGFVFLPLTPVFALFLGHTKMAGLELLFVYIGVQWAWGTLRPFPLKISGPESLLAAQKTRPAEPAGDV